jgi:hypothetical protein
MQSRLLESAMVAWRTYQLRIINTQIPSGHESRWWTDEVDRDRSQRRRYKEVDFSWPK